MRFPAIIFCSCILSISAQPGFIAVPVWTDTWLGKRIADANKVRHTEHNAFAVLIGRTLEIICQDKNARGICVSKMLFRVD